MKKLFFAIFFSIAFLQNSFSQSSEGGIMLGISSYKGDIVQSLFDMKFFHFAVGAHYRRSMNNHWSYRAGLNYGTISGEDAETDIPFNLYRNLNFKSSILEGHFVFEFNFFQYQTANRASTWTPYIMGGLAIYKFNPKGLLGDEWIELQPLSTEGQDLSVYPDRKKYGRIQFSIPFGGGFKIRLNDRFGMAIEAGARRTFTDYLDDISTTYANKAALLATNGALAVTMSDRSIDRLNDNNNDRQRGDAAHRDWYMFAGVQLNYTLSKKYNDSCRPFKGKLR